jgi:hypothetical protein
MLCFLMKSMTPNTTTRIVSLLAITFDDQLHCCLWRHYVPRVVFSPIVVLCVEHVHHLEETNIVKKPVFVFTLLKFI